MKQSFLQSLTASKILKNFMPAMEPKCHANGLKRSKEIQGTLYPIF
jgi:hypothetical protein